MKFLQPYRGSLLNTDGSYPEPEICDPADVVKDADILGDASESARGGAGRPGGLNGKAIPLSTVCAFLSERCLRGRFPHTACRVCEDACPVRAIAAGDGGVHIDAERCDGCGVCALICPADALCMIDISSDDLLVAIRLQVETQPPEAPFPPVVVIGDEESPMACIRKTAGPTGGRPICFCVDQIGRIGLDVMLGAFAYGVGKLFLVCRENTPQPVKEAVLGHVRLAMTILEGLAMPAGKINFMEGDRMLYPDTPVDRPVPQSVFDPMVSPALFSPFHARRELVHLSTQHLFAFSGAATPLIPLPAGTPYGTVAVDAAVCTLCGACADACPTGALIAGAGTRGLSVRESRCLQCGACRAACPESAIRCLPRLCCDGSIINRQVSVHGSKPQRPEA